MLSQPRAPTIDALPAGVDHPSLPTPFPVGPVNAYLLVGVAKGAWAATTQLNLNFAAPIKDGTLTAHGEIISLTKRTAVVRIDVHNGDRLAGAAQGTVTITQPR